ncbi:hypothetical protein EB083_04960 [bacterium]|nr:hypothetical protein [bacterium]
MEYGFAEVMSFAGRIWHGEKKFLLATNFFASVDNFSRNFARETIFGSSGGKSLKSRSVLAISFQKYSNRCSTVIRNRESKVRK